MKNKIISQISINSAKSIEIFFYLKPQAVVEPGDRLERPYLKCHEIHFVHTIIVRSEALTLVHIAPLYRMMPEIMAAAAIHANCFSDSRSTNRLCFPFFFCCFLFYGFVFTNNFAFESFKIFFF